MTLLDFKSRIAAVVAEAEQELRGIILVAAQGVQRAQALQSPAAADLKALEVKLDDAVVFIDGFKGVINLSGATPTLNQLILITQEMEKMVADAPSFLAQAQADLAEASTVVTNVATTIEQDIESI